MLVVVLVTFLGGPSDVGGREIKDLPYLRACGTLARVVEGWSRLVL